MHRGCDTLHDDDDDDDLIDKIYWMLCAWQYSKWQSYSCNLTLNLIYSTVSWAERGHISMYIGDRVEH